MSGVGVGGSYSIGDYCSAAALRRYCIEACLNSSWANGSRMALRLIAVHYQKFEVQKVRGDGPKSLRRGLPRPKKKPLDARGSKLQIHMYTHICIMYIYIYIYTYLSLYLSIYIGVWAPLFPRSKCRRLTTTPFLRGDLHPSTARPLQTWVWTDFLGSTPWVASERASERLYMYTSVCVYIYIYIYTHICIYIYIYMHGAPLWPATGRPWSATRRPETVITKLPLLN